MFKGVEPWARKGSVDEVDLGPATAGLGLAGAAGITAVGPVGSGMMPRAEEGTRRSNATNAAPIKA